MVFFCGKFSPPSDKKKGWQIQQKDFVNLKKSTKFQVKKIRSY
jgi:hypothetical protein